MCMFVINRGGVSTVVLVLVLEFDDERLISVLVVYFIQKTELQKYKTSNQTVDSYRKQKGTWLWSMAPQSCYSDSHFTHYQQLKRLIIHLLYFFLIV